MSNIKVIQAIMDAADSLHKADIIPEDQKFKILKQSLFKGRDITQIQINDVFSEILQQIQEIPSLSNQLVQDESLKSHIVGNLNILTNFLKSFLIFHEPLDKTVSDKLVKSLEITILDIENLSKSTVQRKMSPEEITDDSTIHHAMEDLRLACEIMQSTPSFDQIQQAIDKAVKTKELMISSSPEERNQADLFIQAIQEIVHLYIMKEIKLFKNQKLESLDTHLVSDFKNRLKEFQVLANGWSGSHRDYLLEQIEDLHKKL